MRPQSPQPPPRPRATPPPPKRQRAHQSAAPNAQQPVAPTLTEAERKRRQFIFFGVLLGLPLGIVLTLFLGLFAYVLVWDEEAEAWRGWGIVFFAAFMAIVFALVWRFWARYVGAAIPPNLPQKILSDISRRFKKLLFVTK
jgi:MFS family permease